MAELNEIIHQPVRLRVMAVLVTLSPGDEVDFAYLRNLLDVTDGNLGAHLRKLEEAGYISVNKTYVERKPRTHHHIAVIDRKRRELIASIKVIFGYESQIISRLEYLIKRVLKPARHGKEVVALPGPLDRLQLQQPGIKCRLNIHARLIDDVIVRNQHWPTGNKRRHEPRLTTGSIKMRQADIEVSDPFLPAESIINMPLFLI